MRRDGGRAARDARRLRLVHPVAVSPDTPGARRALAERYTAAVDQCVSATSTIEATAAALALPAGTREVFVAALHREIRWPAILEWQIEALASHMTVAELEALVAFVSTPAGMSALGKLAALNAEAAPVLAGELQRAIATALEEALRAADGSAAGSMTEGTRPSA